MATKYILRDGNGKKYTASSISILFDRVPEDVREQLPDQVTESGTRKPPESIEDIWSGVEDNADINIERVYR